MGFIVKLYHISPSSSLNSIVISGLIPGYKRGLTDNCSKFYKDVISKLVFLTDDPDYIIDTQAGPDWIKFYKPIIFQLDVSDLKLGLWYGWCGENPCPHEFVYKGQISPSKINLIYSPLYT